VWADIQTEGATCLYHLTVIDSIVCSCDDLISAELQEENLACVVSDEVSEGFW
jgi:hypothetical protein